MKFHSVAPLFIVVASLFVFGCCPTCGGLFKDPNFASSRVPGEETAPINGECQVECELCGQLGLDFSTDAALLGVGFIADNLLSNGIGAEANLEVGQGSGEDDGSDYDPSEFLSKTTGFGSDYRVVWGNVHARYPLPLGDDGEFTVVPLAGLGYYRWTMNDCDDCDAYTEATIDLGAELEWKRFGLKLILPLGDAPDVAMRVRYHVPIGR